MAQYNIQELDRDDWLRNTFPEWGTWLNEEIDAEVVPEGKLVMWWLGCTGIWFKTPGGADFTVDFMRRLLPYATVISSGDNESYAHPRAEALGCAGKYSRGERPKVFSTELARSINSGGDILYGMINCRTDGSRIVMAQMKERRTGADIWDSYEL